MFRIHNPNKPLPLTLTEVNWPRQEEISDPEGPECLALVVVDPKEPNNRDLMIPLLVLTEEGVSLNETAKDELNLAGYNVPDGIFSERGLRVVGASDEA